MACRVPLILVLALAMLVLAVVPAVLVYIIVFLAMNDSMDILNTASKSSMKDLVVSLQTLLISKSLQTLVGHLETATAEVEAQLTILQVKGIPQLYLGPSFQVMDPLLAVSQSIFASMKTHEYFSIMAVRGMEVSDTTFPFGIRTFWLGQQGMWIDLLSPGPKHTIYTSMWTLVPNRTLQINRIFYPDQTTGVEVVQLAALSKAPMFILPRSENTWMTDVTFANISGQPEIYLYSRSIPALNNTFADVILAFNVHTISDELRDEVKNTPQNRLFIFLRQSHGHLIGASHGKFYSMSDVDIRQQNTLKNPPNMSLYWAYTCLDSTDTLILEACRNLYALSNQSWADIPEGSFEMQLNGTDYWVAVGYSSAGLNCTVVALQHRATIMAAIEQKETEAHNKISAKKILAYEIVGVSTVIAALCPALIGWLLQRRLKALGSGLGDKDAHLYSIRTL